MRAITVDPVARTAHVQAGATAGELIEAAEKIRVGDHYRNRLSVGMTGLTLGRLWFADRVYGLAADNLLSTGRHCRRAAYYREHRRASRPALGTTRRR